MSARFHLIPENPAPPGAEVVLLPAFDRRNIRYATFPTSTRPLKGTVVLLSGRNETIEKYFETVRDFSARGFHVVAMDWRGQGGSDRLLPDPARGYVQSFDHYVADLDLLFREAVAPRCPPPFFIFAHSTGALVSLLAVPKLGGRVKRMVFGAPFLAMEGFPLSLANIHRLARALSLLGLGSRYLGGGPKPRFNTAFKNNRLTSDPVRFGRNAKLLDTFPLLGLGSPTAAWVLAACDAIATVTAPAFMAKIRVPILFVAAGADRIVSTRAIEDYARRLPSGALLTIDGARHEIMQEADRFRDQMLAAFDAFVPGGDAGGVSPP